MMSLKRHASAQAATRRRDGGFLLAFVGTACLLSLIWPVPKWLPALYGGLGALLFVLYTYDKLAAIWGVARIPEVFLHGFALMGGWPGALLAQVLLRHKSTKPEFRRLFWLTVLLNLIALCVTMVMLTYANGLYL